MLTKVKRQLFSRNRKPGPLLVQFAVKVRDDTPQRQLEEDGTQELIAVLTETFHALGPLTPAVYGFLKLIETLEVEILYGHKELWDGLNDSFRALSDYISGVADTSRLPSISDLIRGIEKETGLAFLAGQRVVTERYTANKRRSEVLGCLRRVQALLGRFLLNENTSLWTIPEDQTADNELRHMLHSPTATYRATETTPFDQNGCIPNTRVDILNELRDWARLDNFPNICWLNGMAGTGKTAIICSLCEYLETTGQLAASFFCSRQDPTTRDVRLIIPSISYQLSLLSRPFRSALFGMVGQVLEICDQPLRDQFEQLIAVPLQKSGHTFMSTPVVVIDCLDGCVDHEGVTEFLNTLLYRMPGLRIKVIVASRRLPNIAGCMQNKKHQGNLTELNLDTLDRWFIRKDIRTYLSVMLHRFHLPPVTLQRISEYSGLWFTCAAAIVQYMESKLPSVDNEYLTVNLPKIFLPIEDINEHFDELYTVALTEAFGDVKLGSLERATMMLLLHMVVRVQEPIHVDFLVRLMGFSEVDSLHVILGPLLSVLHISKATGLVTALHGSLYGYVSDRSRSRAFYCDPGEYNSQLALICFEVICTVEPPFNICDLESSYLMDSKVSDLDKKVTKAISSELLYACLSIGAHIEQAHSSLKLVDELHRFLSTKLLLWMEILNLKGHLGHGIEVLGKFKNWLKKTKHSRELENLLDDAQRFLMEYASSPIAKSTPHIYVSALPFWPDLSPVSTHYRKLLPGLIGVRGTAKEKRGFASVAVFTIAHQTRCIAYSPDGEQIVSACNDATIRIWDVRTGQPIRRPLVGHTRSVMSVAYSPDGAYIVSGSVDGTIRIWDANNGQQVVSPLVGHIGAVWSVAYSPDGAYIASGSVDESIRIWDASGGEPVGRALSGHTGAVWSVAYSPDGRHIVSGSHDETIRVWDASTGIPSRRVLRGHTGSVWSVGYSLDGARIISSSYDKTVRIWDARTGKPVGQPLLGHTESVWSVTYTPDGACIVSGSLDKTVRIWDAHTGRPVGRPLAAHTESIFSVSCSPGGEYIASVANDDTLRIWDLHSARAMRFPLKGHTTPVSCLSYSPDGARIVSGGYGTTIRTWDAHTGQSVGFPFKGHTGPVSSLAYSPDGTRIVSGSLDNTIRVWDADTGRMTGLPLRGHTYAVYSVAFSPDGKRIISGSYDTTIRIWDAYSGQPVGEPLEGHAKAVWVVTYSPSGVQFASCSVDETIRIWDARSGQPITPPLIGHAGPVWAVVYSPDSSTVASGSWDSSIRIWNANTGRPTAQAFRGHTGAVWSVAYSPDGTQIVSGSEDKTIRIWDVFSGETVGLPLEGHMSWIYSVAYSPDGAYIASGSRDCTILISKPGAEQAWVDLAESDASTSSQLQDSWTLDENGWVVDSRDMPLIWVPEDVRDALLHPGQIARIYSEGELKLDFTGALLGKQWKACYSPGPTSDAI